MDRYVVRHAGTDGMNAKLNTRSFQLETSTDGQNWKMVNIVKNNIKNVTDIDFDPIRARYARLKISDAGSDGIARIGDVEIYGKREHEFTLKARE